MSLLSGTAGAIGDTENTDSVSLPDTGLSVSIAYNDNGPFRMGDVVKITATFSEPVMFAQAMVEDDVLLPVNMTNICDTVWDYNYEVPEGINDAVDVTIYGYSLDDDVEKTDTDAFVVDNEAPRFKGIEPSSDTVNTNCVLFEFSAFDRLDNTIAYAIYINGTEKETGTISSNGYAKFDTELADGYYQWEITLKDDAGNIGTSGVIDLYVDTEDPCVTLVSPEDCFVASKDPSDLIDPFDPRLNISDPFYDPFYDPFFGLDPLMTFNFTSQDDLSANCNLDLYYQVYINGKPDEAMSGAMISGDYINIDIPAGYFEDGAYNWSVEVEDMAGNCFTSEVREFYVNCDKLEVILNSPNGGFVPANQEFNFSVIGGAGLPFDYELLVDGRETCVKGTFVVGEDLINFYSVTATVEDAVEIPWTVRITDCAGNEYTPEPLFISVDTKAPAPVANLCVFDALSNTEWYYTYDEPGLYVCWDKNTEGDLNDEMPYVIFISDSEPSCLEDMELAVPVSGIYEDDTYMYMNIGEYGGKCLVYGKDYWVAVIALDRAGNYADCFAVCGPVQKLEMLSG